MNAIAYTLVDEHTDAMCRWCGYHQHRETHHVKIVDFSNNGQECRKGELYPSSSAIATTRGAVHGIHSRTVHRGSSLHGPLLVCSVMLPTCPKQSCGFNTIIILKHEKLMVIRVRKEVGCRDVVAWRAGLPEEK